MGMILPKTNTIVVLIALITLATQISSAGAQLIDDTEESMYEQVASIATQSSAFAAELNVTPRQKKELADALSHYKLSALLSFSLLDLQEGKGVQLKPTQPRKSIRESVEQILIPAQIERAIQFARQVRFQMYDNINSLVSERLSNHLDLTKEQRDQIKEKSKEHEEKVQAKIEQFKKELLQLRKKNEKELVAILDEKQRKEFRTLFGDIVYRGTIKMD